jgi:hypothetical protein
MKIYFWIIPLVLFINVSGQELYEVQKKVLSEGEHHDLPPVLYSNLGLHNDDQPIPSIQLGIHEIINGEGLRHFAVVFSLRNNTYISLMWHSNSIYWIYLTNTNGVLQASEFSINPRKNGYSSKDPQSESVKSDFIKEKNYWLKIISDSK